MGGDLGIMVAVVDAKVAGILRLRNESSTLNFLWWLRMIGARRAHGGSRANDLASDHWYCHGLVRIDPAPSAEGDCAGTG